jgi:hypothetical protein
MARHAKVLNTGEQLCRHLSLGVLAHTFTSRAIGQVLRQSGRGSQRVRAFPAVATVYFVMALGLFMTHGYGEVLRTLTEGLVWLGGRRGRLVSKGAVSSARRRLGAEPLRLLHRRQALPFAKADSGRAFFRGLRMVVMDGSLLALQDTAANAKAFGRPSNQSGTGAWPMLRFVALLEAGTRAIWGAATGPYHSSEVSLARELVGRLDKGMLCLADRLFPGYTLWKEASAKGCHLLWRTKTSLRLNWEKDLPDGSWIGRWISANPAERRANPAGLRVRVIEYQLETKQIAGPPPASPSSATTTSAPTYRLMSTIVDPAEGSAQELASLYPERWEIEIALDECKTHLREHRIVLRSQTPELVEQEFWGLLLAHYAVRKLVFEAAVERAEDPDDYSFTHGVRVIRRKLAGSGPPSPPRAKRGVVGRRARGTRRAKS